MKNKTALTELKDKFMEAGTLADWMDDAFDIAIEKERKQIIDAHIDGQCVIVDTVSKELKFDFKETGLEISKAKNDSNDIEAINYFTQTYNNE